MSTEPIACSLSGSELAARRESLLEIGPGEAPITLELTGPPGTVELLATLGLGASSTVQAGVSSRRPA